VAAVNCLNFGNPEHPEVMWQLSESVDGMAEACDALGIPVVGGNVSLYNESAGADIDPTPVVAVLGLIDCLASQPPAARLAEGATIVLLGEDPESPARSLAGSAWAIDLRGHRGGSLAPLDLAAQRRLIDLVLALVSPQLAGAPGIPGVTGRLVEGIHDVSSGGLGVALCEAAFGSPVGPAVGFRVHGVADRAELFSEEPGRVLVCTHFPEQLAGLATEAGVGARSIGLAGGNRLLVDSLLDLDIAEADRVWRSSIAASLDELAG
jgi:phosphoribosylformylglycinamidine synthase